MKDISFNPADMRQRIQDELSKQNRSQRSVVKAAGLGHGFLTNILVRNQIPSVDKLDALCRELNVSVYWVVYGIDFPADANRIFTLMRRNPKKFYALLDLLE